MNKEAILEGLLFVVGDEGLTLDNICEIMMIEKSEAQELLKKLREEYSKEIEALELVLWEMPLNLQLKGNIKNIIKN